MDVIKTMLIFVACYDTQPPGAKLFGTVMQMTAFIKWALLVIHCVPYHSFPKAQCLCIVHRGVSTAASLCKTHPYQAEQGATRVTCQVTVSPLLPAPFCAQNCSLSSFTGSVSPCPDRCARPSLTAERMICNERDSGEMGNSLPLLPQLLIFLWNWLHQPTFCRVGILETTTATKPPQPLCALWQPNRLAQMENGIDRFGKGQTRTLMQADTGGLFFIKSFTA